MYFFSYNNYQYFFKGIEKKKEHVYMIPYKSVWECFLIFDRFDCRPWSSLELQPLDFKGSVELLASSLNKHAVNIPQEQVGKRISIGRNRGICFHFGDVLSGFN